MNDTWVRALLPAVALFFAASIDRNYQTDLWHHLARGRVIVEEGEILNEDRFTYTVHGQPLRDVNWGTQVIFYRLFQWGGLELLQSINALILAVMLGLLTWHCQRRSQSWLLAMSFGLFTLLDLWQLILILPHTFSLFHFVLLYFILENAKKHRWLLIIPPLIQALWVNLHGAFPIGLVLIGCYLFGSFVERWLEQGRAVFRDAWLWCLLTCLIFSMLATLLNPYGWEVIRYVGTTSGRAAERKIDEWLPPGMNQLISLVWIASVMGLLILLSTPGKRPTPKDVCLLLCFLLPTFGSVRMIAWWLLISAPILCGLLSERWRPKEEEPESSMGAKLVCFVFLLLAVIGLPWFEKINPVHRTVRPTHRVEHDLAELTRQLKPGVNVFTRFEWAEYVTWATKGSNRVHMDGRIEIIPDESWQEYKAITQGRGDWQQILDRHQVGYLILDQGAYHSQILPLVEASETWQRVDQKGDAILFVRRK